MMPEITQPLHESYHLVHTYIAARRFWTCRQRASLAKNSSGSPDIYVSVASPIKEDGYAMYQFWSSVDSEVSMADVLPSPKAPPRKKSSHIVPEIVELRPLPPTPTTASQDEKNEDEDVISEH